jgi:hypothetical protein
MGTTYIHRSGMAPVEPKKKSEVGSKMVRKNFFITDLGTL